MRRLIVMALLGFGLLPTLAQEPQPTATATAQPITFGAIVDVESAFVRATPDFDGERIASVFEGEYLEVVSRNLDGQWFEVRRPNHMAALGWAFENVLAWDFLPESLPLGDYVTGVAGPTPITSRTDFAVYMQEGAALRSQPDRNGEIVRNLPPLVTLPVIARNQNGSWLQVNYLGYQGWVVSFTTRELGNVLSFPEAAHLPPLAVPDFPVIPPEIQLAQINRLRAYIDERMGLARSLETFWWRVFRGEVMPCDAPPELTGYQFTLQDVRELPELERELPRLDQAVAYINTAIDILNDCGVIRPEDVIEARNSAINARVIFDAALERLETLEEIIQ